MAGLRLSEHVKLDTDGAPLICIGKERTKPGRRDAFLEVPDEVAPLLRHHVGADRSLLLGNHRDHGALFVSQGGGALGTSGLSRVCRVRSREILGVERNPHLVRKSWATGFGEFSRGDWLTASRVLDSSPRTIQRNYARLSDARLIERFDKRSMEIWSEIQTRAETRQ